MARKTHVLLLDDLDGGEATETVSFGLDGQVHEIDLSIQHAQEMRATLQPFVEHARIAGRVRAAQRTNRQMHFDSATGQVAGGGKGPSEERAWLRDNGYPVRVNGRIPVDMHAAWTAHARTALASSSEVTAAVPALSFVGPFPAESVQALEGAEPIKAANGTGEQAPEQPAKRQRKQPAPAITSGDEAPAKATRQRRQPRQVVEVVAADAKPKRPRQPKATGPSVAS